MTTQELARGFADPSRASQALFRAAMWALSRPGRPQELATDLVPPAPLAPGAAALALTLCDYETPIFLDAALAAGKAVGDFLTFHTGAPLTVDPGEARFALISNPLEMLDFSRFAQGSPDYPDASTTLILQVSGLAERGFSLAGPGIDRRVGFGASPLPGDFAARMAANRALYPRGVDLLLAGDGKVAGLPRSVVVKEG